MSPPWEDSVAAANGKAVRENFANWFGKSRVLDKARLPLRLYHGSTVSFDRFDPALSNQNTKTHVPKSCFFFASSHEAACSYAGQKTPEQNSRLPTEALYDEWLTLLKRHGPTGPASAFFKQHEVACEKQYKPGGNVMGVYLHAAKILSINAKGAAWDNIRFDDEDWSINDLAEHARLRGYEGLRVKNIHDRQEGRGPVSDTYAVFHPHQIKSAWGNSGLYLKGSDSLDDQDAARQLRLTAAAKSFLAEHAFNVVHAARLSKPRLSMKSGATL